MNTEAVAIHPLDGKKKTRPATRPVEFFYVSFYIFVTVTSCPLRRLTFTSRRFSPIPTHNWKGMKNLIEIARIVNKQRVRKIEIFDSYNLKHRNSKFNDFYEALAADRFKNDRDAAAALYQCSPQDARYRQLKSRFRRRLLNTLFFLDVNKAAAASYERAHFTCRREWSLICILQDFGAHQSAQALAKSMLTTAQKFHLTEIVFNTARVLREYAMQERAYREFTTYNELVNETRDVLIAEAEAEEICQQVRYIYHTPGRLDPEAAPGLDVYCDTIMQLSERYPNSPTVQYYAFLVWANRYELNGDYALLLEVCDQVEQYLDRHPSFYQENKLVVFFTKRMAAFLNLRDYQQGQLNAERCLGRFPTGSLPWFHFMEYHLLLALHTRHHIQAIAIFNETVRERAFRKLPVAQRQKWQLFEVYLTYLLGQLPGGLKVRISPTQSKHPLTVTDYLANPPAFGREQLTLQVLHLFVQVALQLQRRAYAEAAEGVQQLRHLANRRLNKDEDIRAIALIRLMQQMNKVDFHAALLRNTAKYLRTLEEHPAEYRGLPAQLEVIPFEQLYDYLLPHLR